MRFSTPPKTNNQTKPLTQVATTHLRLPSSKALTEEGLQDLLHLYQLIMDNVPLAIFWKDRNSVYLGCNRNFANDADIGIPEEIVGKTDYDLAWTQEQADAFRQIDRHVMESNSPHQSIESLTTVAGYTIWVETNKVPLHDTDGKIIGILGIYRDITKRRQTQEDLRKSQEMLQLVMDNIPQYIFWKDRNSVFLGCNRNFADAAGVSSPEDIIGKTDYDMPWANEEADWYQEVDRRVMSHNKPELHIAETQLMADGKHAWVHTSKIPLHDADGKVVGILGTYEDITERKQTEEALQRAYDELELRVKERTAELSAANERLKQEIKERKQIEAVEREQRTLAEALRDTAALLNSTLDLDEVLDRILTTIGRVVPHHTANIILLEADVASIVRYRSQTRDMSQTRDLKRHFTVDELPTLHQMIDTKQPVIIQDTQDMPTWVNLSGESWVRSYLGAPIQVKEEVIGFITLNSTTPDFFNPLHAERLQAFADQAAIAIQNARLYERAQELAALEERQRLARDLHDAVSQTLWTASLMAGVLPTLWVEDRLEGERALNKFYRLTQGALAEMRTLLLELRPQALVKTNLESLLNQLAEAIMSRKKIDVSLSVEGECDLPADVHVGIYRIAQETLNNIVKHSQANELFIKLVGKPNSVELKICDNGRGFDQTLLSPERLGLAIMRERAEAIQADLTIDSAIGRGTEVIIRWATKDAG